MESADGDGVARGSFEGTVGVGTALECTEGVLWKGTAFGVGDGIPEVCRESEDGAAPVYAKGTAAKVF